MLVAVIELRSRTCYRSGMKEIFPNNVQACQSGMRVAPIDNVQTGRISKVPAGASSVRQVQFLHHAIPNSFLPIRI